MIKLSLALLFGVCFCFAAPFKENPVIVTVGKIDAPKVHAGDSILVRLPITVARGFHVNANPAAGEDYIPLAIELADTAGIHIGDIIYPLGQTWRLDGSMEELLVYENRVEVQVPLQIDAKATAGDKVVNGSIEFQACDSKVCFMPETRPLRLQLHILPPR